MRVLYVQYTNPGLYPPLVRGAHLMAEASAQVLMLGTRVPGLDALDIAGGEGVSVRLMPAGTDGWRLKAHYARYAAWVARESSAWQPDWIYASDLLSAPIALLVSAITGARVAYHEHDAPSRDHDSWTIRRCLAARRRLVRQAALVIVPNAERAERLSRDVAGGRPVHTVWNCPRRPTAGPPARDAHDGDATERVGVDDELRVVFRGSINRDRLPETIIHALARASARIALDIVGYETGGSRGYVRELLRLAGQLGVASRVRALGALNEAELGRICARSDVGLALMPLAPADENMRHMAGASNKVFEYLAYGVTPLVTDLPDWRAAFVEPGYALSCNPDDVESVARVLTWAATHRRGLRAMAERGRARLSDDWNYEAQFAPILRAMWAPLPAPTAALGSEGVRCAF